MNDHGKSFGSYAGFVDSPKKRKERHTKWLNSLRQNHRKFR